MRYKIIILFVSLIVLGCAQTATCEKPMIQVGNSCCLDENKNTICDNLEENKTQDAKSSLESSKKPQAVKKNPTLSLTDLQRGLNKTFYPWENLNFSDFERENITGIQNTFNVTNAGRFYVLQIKKDYNYLDDYDNFTDFVDKLYKLESKNWEIDANQIIDSRKLDDPTWNGVTYVYDHDKEEVKIFGKPVYFTKHLLMFDREGLLADYYWDFRLEVYCNPEFVVEIYPGNKFYAPIWLDSQLSTNKERFDDAIMEEKPLIIEAAERVIKLCQGKIDPVQLKPNEIVFFGLRGFYPHEIKLKVGDKLIMHNYNEDYYLGAVFTFVQEVPRKVFTSKGVNHGNFTEVEMKDAGEFTVFFEQYPARAKVIVIN